MRHVSRDLCHSSAEGTRLPHVALAAALAVGCAASAGAAPVGTEADPPRAQHVILMISDGWGIHQIEATSQYRGTTPIYQSWPQHWMATFPLDGDYDPARAWSEFDYAKERATDSAASGTALFSGVKTIRGKVAVSAEGERLSTIADKARALDKGVGAVTTVAVSHATPAAWYAHNDDRFNAFAIAEEGLFGDPTATLRGSGWRRSAREWWEGAKYIGGVWRERGTLAAAKEAWRGRFDLYRGGHGRTLPPADVIIGATTPGFVGERYLNAFIEKALVEEARRPGGPALVERIPGQRDGGRRLLAVAERPDVTRLAGLFGFSYRRADGSGHNPENPTLAEMTRAALAVLERNPRGSVLMVESGAVDFAGHANSMDLLIGEQTAFEEAVEAVAGWVEDDTNDSGWDNTLVIVTGDHETGYLTAGPAVPPDRPLGEVSAVTLALEKRVADGRLRASWEDRDGDGEIDPYEPVHWAWNSDGHTNLLIPLYANGAGAALFDQYAVHPDPVRGRYLDNTDVFKVMDAVVVPEHTRHPDGSETVVIPGGQFWMGCNVALDAECDDNDQPGGLRDHDPFAIDRTQVTVAQYRRCVEHGACSSEGLEIPVRRGEEQADWTHQCNWGRPGRAQHPINCVSWHQARAYCEWRNARLPSEAEWEKAARGTDGRKYPWGNLGYGSVGVANIADETARRYDPDLEVAEGYEDGFYTTAPVGSFPKGASPYGLVDMIGNVWEWTADRYDEEVEVAKPLTRLVNLVFRGGIGAGAASGSEVERVVRGGSWKNPPQVARISRRAKDRPTDRYGNVGFRCAMSLEAI